MSEPIFSVLEIQARWAYSEIVDGQLAHIYDGFAGIEQLRKLRKAGEPFEHLSEVRKFHLAYLCVSARPAFLSFVADVSSFQFIHLTKSHIYKLCVPAEVASEEELQAPILVRFGHVTRLPAFENAKDCDDEVSAPEGYRESQEFLTIGRHRDLLVLLDGYRRAENFVRSSSDKQTIGAFVPYPAKEQRARLERDFTERRFSLDDFVGLLTLEDGASPSGKTRGHWLSQTLQAALKTIRLLQPRHDQNRGLRPPVVVEN